MAQPIEKLDPNFATVDPQSNLAWYDILRLGLEGQGFSDLKHPYDRLPADAEGAVPPAVWTLSHCSAGLFVRFVTDSPQISARWSLRTGQLAMHHMPSTGVSGLDLYTRLEDGSWRYAGTASPSKQQGNQAQLLGGMDGQAHLFMLYLPLYNGVESVEIGIDPGAGLHKAPAWESAGGPICFYGTSIVQGGCASRPGMVHTAILSRRLDRPTINLGFSGNARCEPALAELLARIDACAYVLDPLPNMSRELVEERIEPTVRTLRQARPEAPIVLVESIDYQRPPFVAGPRENVLAKNQALRQAFDRLERSGVENLHYVPGDLLYGTDGEATVDGCHATDIGYQRMADVLEPVLRSVLRGADAPPAFSSTR